MRKLLFVALLFGACQASAQVITQPAQSVNSGCVFQTTPPTLTNGQAGYIQCDSSGRLIASAAGTPPAQTPITAVFSGADTATATATLAAVAGKITFLCGFTVSGLGATAATTVSPTAGALAGGNTFTISGGYVFAAGAAAQSVVVSYTFPTCVGGNGQNSSIVMTVPGAAGNTSTFINAWGYQQ